MSEVWARFLMAIIGLVLAFGAALFSTVAREAGSLWGTLIFSSAALALATIVGLTTVPYLARRVAGGRVRDAFDYDVTRVGIIYVVTIVLIGIAALNTGNNLLYVIVAAMLAAILVSGHSFGRRSSRIRTGRSPARPGFCWPPGAPRRSSSGIGRRWLPTFSTSVIPLGSQQAIRRAGDGNPQLLAFRPGFPTTSSG